MMSIDVERFLIAQLYVDAMSDPDLWEFSKVFPVLRTLPSEPTAHMTWSRDRGEEYDKSLLRLAGYAGLVALDESLKGYFLAPPLMTISQIPSTISLIMAQILLDIYLNYKKLWEWLIHSEEEGAQFEVGLNVYIFFEGSRLFGGYILLIGGYRVRVASRARVSLYSFCCTYYIAIIFRHAK